MTVLVLTVLILMCLMGMVAVILVLVVSDWDGGCDGFCSTMEMSVSLNLMTRRPERVKWKTE